MNKTELIENVVNSTGMKKKDVEAVVCAFIVSIEEALSNGEKVQISGLGSFDVKQRAERVGRNPKTKEKITIPAAKYPAFSASKTLKESVNK
jgi:DNA-binding protein HU-beta